MTSCWQGEGSETFVPLTLINLEILTGLVGVSKKLAARFHWLTIGVSGRNIILWIPKIVELFFLLMSVTLWPTFQVGYPKYTAFAIPSHWNLPIKKSRHILPAVVIIFFYKKIDIYIKTPLDIQFWNILFWCLKKVWQFLY